LKTRKTGLTGKSKSDTEWIYGINPVTEALRAGRKIKKILLSSSRHHTGLEIVKAAEKSNIPLKISEPAFFDRTFSKGHQGIAAEVSPTAYWSLQDILEIPVTKHEAPFFIILDCIEDARNFGALLRVADAAGVHGVIVQSHRSVTINPHVSKVSAGAVEYVPISMVPNIKHALYEMKKHGITIIGTDAHTDQTVWDSDFTEPIALVVGSEGKGLRKTIRTLCDMLVSIPMKGKINSLNVSVATGIFVFEIIRQRLQNK
jgi:23S rRNA (guanosine2251-2'-O)-methyltransferase